MKVLLLFTFLVCTWCCAHALTSGEVRALEDLRDEFDNFAPIGHPWPNGSLYNACSGNYFGVVCNHDTDPHVVQLCVPKSDGEPRLVTIRLIILLLLPFTLISLTVLTSILLTLLNSVVAGGGTLEGSMPESIGELIWLKALKFQGVKLQGIIPDSFENMTVLESISLTTPIAALSRPVGQLPRPQTLPASLGDLPALQTLEVLLTEMTGTIPDSFANLRNLKSLALGSSSLSERVLLSGPIPQGFEELANLTSLKFHGTSLSGFSPSARLDHFHLRHLFLSTNPFFNMDLSQLHLSDMEDILIQATPHAKGKLDLAASSNWHTIDIESNTVQADLHDPFWSNSENLISLKAQGNGFTGYISPLVGRLQRIGLISLQGTFVGSIPAEIGNCSNLSQLEIASTTFTGPLPATLSNIPHLAVLRITDAIDLGPLPSDASLWKMYFLSIISSGLNGTLPLLSIRAIDLHDNHLEGPLPDLTASTLSLKNNKFNGTIPCSLIRRADQLDLSNNHLGPNIDLDCFATRMEHWNAIDLSHNFFISPLPPLRTFSGSEVLSVANFHDNQFYGSVPDSYALIYQLSLANNNLSGNLDSFFHGFQGNILDMSYNSFTGTIPDLSSMHTLIQLKINHNQFSGQIPPVAAELQILNAQNNQLDAIISTEFILSVAKGSLAIIDLSGNKLRCELNPWSSLADLLKAPELLSLKLSNNRLHCDFNSQIELESIFFNPLRLGQFNLASLDISHNNLTGIFDPGIFARLLLLDISYNNFSGTIPLTPYRYLSLTQADISHNSFATDVSLIDNFPFLYALNARSNMLHGTLRILSMPKLESLDYSKNRLNREPDFTSIGVLFDRYALQSLYIQENPLLPPMSTLNSLETGLQRANASQPSRWTGVTCHFLTFFDVKDLTFQFDEDLFDYIQCDCATHYFGGVPDNCHLCPAAVDLDTGLATGVEYCHHENLTMLKNNWLVAQNTLSFTEPSDPLSPAVNHPDEEDFVFQSESCLVRPEQILLQQSNCLGLNLTDTDVIDDDTIAAALKRQCAPGSAGRLCARCICDYAPKNHSDTPVCYYEKALHCTKCSVVLTPRQYIPIVGSLVLVLIIVCTIVFIIVLRNKRVQKTVPWRKLSLPKRLFYRLLYLVSLGNVSILITFVQIFMELTHWDAYAIGGIAKLINLNATSIGIICLFPFLSDPTLELISKTYVPLAVLVLIGCCIGLAELLSRLLTRVSQRSARSYFASGSDSKSLLLGPESLNDGHDRDEDHTSGIVSESPYRSLRSDWTPISGNDQSEVYETLYVEYPTLALLASVSISFTRFIYFSSAISAHEFLFSVFDRRTGVWYLQHYPSLRWDESFKTRYFSFPIIAIFDFILPVGFLVLCFINRDKAKRTRNMQYYGSLFDTFSHKCYWWEIVIIFKKLSIALVLQGVPSSNVLQVTMIVTIIGGIQLIQMSLQPWRRKIENTADSISSLVLIGALLAARSGRYNNSSTSVYYVVAFAVGYIVLSLVLIVWQMFNGETEYQKRIARLASENPSESDLEYDSKVVIKTSQDLKTLDRHATEESETVSDFGGRRRPEAPLSFRSNYSASPAGSSKLLD